MKVRLGSRTSFLSNTYYYNGEAGLFKKIQTIGGALAPASGPWLRLWL
jgi:hypothetical protein